jgi:hypothetical protein
MRRRKKLLYPICVSVPTACAIMESAVSPKVLKEAITTGLLPYYRSPTGRRRVLIEDLIKYVRQHWARTGVIG